MTGPAANQQAYNGFADYSQTTSEYNRMAFLVRSILAQTASATLVLVKAVNGDKVDVQPMVDQTDGAGNAVPHGVIHGLPCWRLQGGNSAVIVTPAVGDIGLALFCSTDISNVKRTKKPGTPGSARRNDWADGVYLGGLLNVAATQFVRMDADGITITAAPGKTVVINAPAGLTVHGAVTLPDGATIGGVAFGSHKHTGVTTGGGTSGGPTA